MRYNSNTTSNPGPAKHALQKSALAVLIAQLIAGPALADTVYEVTSNLDTKTQDGSCTLREALARAKLNDTVSNDDCKPVGTGPDRITFNISTPTTISLSQSATNSLIVDDDITIQGPGSAADLIIDGSGGGTGPVFSFANTDTLVNAVSNIAVNNVTITGGSASGPGSLFAAGFNAGPNTEVVLDSVTLSNNLGIIGGAGFINADVTINNSLITGNNASNKGGGLYVKYAGTLSLTNTTLSSNHSGSTGGGIYNQGTATLRNSIISGNTSDGHGAGIYSQHSTIGSTNTSLSVLDNTFVRNNTTTDGFGAGIYSGNTTFTITNSTVSGNTGASNTARGGGIFVRNGSASMTNATISSNTAAKRGGGIYLGDATTAISDSTISSNTLTLSAQAFGGGINIFSGPTTTITNTRITDNSGPIGGGIHANSNVDISNSTISGNTATGGNGGGIYQDNAYCTISASTISGNTAGDGGGALLKAGGMYLTNSTVSSNRATGGGSGGIRASGGYLKLFNSTVAFNKTVNTASGPGGIGNFSTMLLDNSILSDNDGLDCTNFGSLYSAGNNLVQNESGCATALSGQILGVSADLSPLRDNGGPTFTHALCKDSPATDQGNQAQCVTNSITLDQRGESRDASCDIGAYEVTGPVDCSGPSNFFVIPLPGKAVIIVL